MPLHKDITGANNHEPKGVETASAGAVYVADGSGSGDWTVSTNSFGAQLLHVQDKKTAGTAAQSLPFNTWVNRVITTTLTNEIAGSSVGGTNITLPAGTYYVDAEISVGNSGLSKSTVDTYARPEYKSRLMDLTESSALLYSNAAFGGATVGDNYEAGGTFEFYTESVDFAATTRLVGRFTLSATTNLAFQSIQSGASSRILGRGGLPTGVGDEVYLNALIWKI